MKQVRAQWENLLCLPKYPEGVLGWSPPAYVLSLNGH